MPYRRFPNTDAARLRALKTVLDSNELYTVDGRFIDWQLMNRARNAYDKLLTAVSQYRVCYSAQVRNAGKTEALQGKATLYVSHFLQVLFMAVERGEIKRGSLPLYGLDENTTVLPPLNAISGLIAVGRKTVEGEKARLRSGGRPIYNPSAGMVGTHLDIFVETYQQQKALRERTSRAQKAILALRPEADDVIVNLWNQITAHYSELPTAERIEAEKRLGVVYYYRKNEKKKPNYEFH